MLRDLGADVVKIEPPTGDLLRGSSPRVNSIAMSFVHQNLGKRNVSIETRDPKGYELVRALCDKADVVLENFRPGTMEKMGLGYETLRETNLGIVFASISGYGQTGVWKNRRAYAMLVQAEMGYMEGDARYTGGPLQQEPYAHGDLYAGTHCCVGILSALLQRTVTGEGGQVDVDMAEAILFMNESATTLASGMSEVLPLPTMGSPTFETADGRHVCVAFDPAERGVFKLYIAAMEFPELAEDPRFSSRQVRVENREELLSLIQEWALSFGDAAEFEAHLAKHGLVGGLVRTVSDVPELEWAKQRGAFIEVSDRGKGTLRVPNSPWRFSTAETGGEGVAAYRGEHNREVLRDWLSMPQKDIDTLEATHILSHRGPTARP